MFDYEEYSKISVHNHYGGNGADRLIKEDISKEITFDMSDAIAKITNAYESRFNLLAFTNSNTILPIEYIKLKYFCEKLNINLIPGVEINIANKSKKKYLHCTLLFSPKLNIFVLNEELNKMINNNKEFSLSIDDLVNLIFKRKVIIIPHGVKQSGGGKSASKNVEQFKEIIAFDRSLPVLIEDNKHYNIVTLKENIKELLSDVELNWLDNSSNISCADRQLCSEIESPTYIWGNNTFDDLYFASIMKGSRIKRDTNIINKTNYISEIIIESKITNPQVLPTTIKCSHGLNSIIGKSGSGKTLLLNSINRGILGEDLKHKISGKSDYTNIYKDVNIRLIDNSGNDIDVNDKWEIFEGENLYNQILQIYKDDKSEIVKKFNLDINSEKFNLVISEYMKKINDYVSKSIELNELQINISGDLSRLQSNIKFLNENDIKGKNNISYFYDVSINNKISDIQKEIDEIKGDRKSILDSIKKLQDLSSKYKINAALDESLNYIVKVFNAKIIYNGLVKKTKQIDLQININKKKKIYDIVNSYNKTMGNKIAMVNTKKQENLELIANIIENLKKMVLIRNSYIIPVLEQEEFNESLILKDNELAKIDINDVILKFKYESRDNSYDDLFPNNIGSKISSINRSEFKRIDELDLSSIESVGSFLNIFIEKEYKQPIQINMDYNKYLKFEILLKSDKGKFENIENMSAGELSKAYITNMIDMQVNKTGSNMIILFDQPEANLEKKFILDDLVNKFDLMRNNYQVFITTHEPLLVVNADSNNIIRAENEKKLGKSNEIKYSTLSFVDLPDAKEKMVEKIAELVDGSHKAVKDRNKIYGGMLYEN